MAALPAIEIVNRQRKIPVDRSAIQSAAQKAVLEVLKIPPMGTGGIEVLDEITVAIVSDKVITGVHREFMNDPTPTDVITFDHGELVISAETALRQATGNHTSTHYELVLYIVHGLLHLHGYDDLNATDKVMMDEIQFRLVKEILRHSSGQLAP